MPERILPKFLIADDLDSDRLFVVHTEEPRFIAEVLDHGQEAVLDPYWFNPSDELSNHALTGIMREASDFYQRSLDKDRSDRN